MCENNNCHTRLSIILPVYNREKYLERSIDSILSQTFTDWELIIVDDGSTDRSLSICQGYMQRDCRIKVFHTDNFGVSHARNIGLDNACGEWFAFIDSDDEYLPDAFETMFRYSDGVNIVISEALRLPSYLITGMRSPEPVRFSVTSPISNELLKNYAYFSPWAKIFRSSAINLRFDESMQKNEDSVFGLEAVSEAKYIHYVPVITYLYYSYSELSLNYTFYISQLYCIGKLYEACLRCFDDKNVHIWAGNYIAENSIYFFANLAFNQKFPRSVRETIIQNQFNGNLLPHIKELKHAVPGLQWKFLWETICTGNPRQIIDEYEKHREMFIFSEEEQNEKSTDDESPKMDRFYIRLAGLVVEIKHRYNLIKEKCADYITSRAELPDISACVQHKRIEYSKQYRLYFDGELIDNDYAEFDALPYRFYGELPKFDAFWLHAVVIEKDGVAYAFTAPPGVGKSTHAGLWLKAFPDAKVINGDNPIIRLNSEDGKFYAYGTPFCGKEGYNENRAVPLKAVCFLERGKINEIHPVNPKFVLTELMKDNFCINEKNGEAHYKLYKKFIEKTEFYSLNCNMDIEAAKVALYGMTHNRAM